MSFGENTLHPLEILDAREAQFKASELQRDNGDELAAKHREISLAEFRYRRALTERIKQLHHGEDGEKGMAISMCETVAKGEESIALLRRERDDLRGDLAKLDNESFRLAADRRGLDGLVRWSMGRDLRVDTPPADWTAQETRPGAGDGLVRFQG